MGFPAQQQKFMILTEFSKYLQEKEQEIVENKSCTRLLSTWIKTILEKNPKNNVEKIIHAEITLAKNNVGDYLLVAKSESGRILTNALYNFALSYEQHVMKKWLNDKIPNDFKDK